MGSSAGSDHVRLHRSLGVGSASILFFKKSSFPAVTSCPEHQLLLQKPLSGPLLGRPHSSVPSTLSFVFLCPRLKRSPLKVRFCTNESQKSRRELVGLLQRLGFDISEGEVTAPAPATCQILKERGLRPHLLIHDGRLT